jgi:hypothetical protein
MYLNVLGIYCAVTVQQYEGACCAYSLALRYRAKCVDLVVGVGRGT